MNDRDLDRYLVCCTEDVELRTPFADLDGTYVGADGIKRFFADIEDAGPDFRLDLEHLELVGEGRALALLRASATGRTSGLPIVMETANVYEFAEGRIKSVLVFTDRAEALAAVGLSEKEIPRE